MMNVLRYDVKHLEWVFDGISADTIRLSISGNQLLEVGYESSKFVIRSLENDKLNIRPVAVNMIEITLSK